jgi:hypothetical protein
MFDKALIGARLNADLLAFARDNQIFDLDARPFVKS